MSLSEHSPMAVAGLFYEAAANPALWPTALGVVAKTFGSRGALLPARTFVPGTLIHSPGMGDTLDQFFSQGWHERDQRTDAARPLVSKSGFIADHDLFSAEEMESSAYYRSFARDAGVPWFSAAVLAVEPGDNYVAISLQRSAKEGPFAKAELSALDALLPHLRNAAALALVLGELRGKTLVEGLEMGGEPAILVDQNGTVKALNARAQAILGDGLSIRRGRLAAERPRDNAALVALIAAACSPQPADSAHIRPIVIGSSSGRTPLVVRTAPVRRTGSDVFGFSGAMVMLTQLDTPPSVPEDVLASIFGLTRREAQVMSLVGQGLALDRIAAVLDVSREAVRFHLKAVFSKTNTHRQSEIVAIHAHLGHLS